MSKMKKRSINPSNSIKRPDDGTLKATLYGISIDS